MEGLVHLVHLFKLGSVNFFKSYWIRGRGASWLVYTAELHSKPTLLKVIFDILIFRKMSQRKRVCSDNTDNMPTAVSVINLGKKFVVFRNCFAVPQA